MQVSCKQINEQSRHKEDRVQQFAVNRPECGCEHESLSDHSPGLIANHEMITRMVCSPMHINHKKPNKVKPSFLSYAESRGVSMQRCPLAENEELKNCVVALLGDVEERAWLGYIEASAGDIRNVRRETDQIQLFCVADAALEFNRAHAELHLSTNLEEADRIESRRLLLQKFSEIKKRGELNGGEVWKLLPKNLQDRVLPPGFIS